MMSVPLREARENFEREWAWIAHDVGEAVPEAELEETRTKALGLLNALGIRTA